MDLQTVNEECKQAYLNKWVEVGASKLCINYAMFACEELKLSKKIKSSISTDDLAFLISTNIVVDWSGLHDVHGNDIPYSQLNAFNSLANDLNFLNLVSELSFERSNFV